jgi:hypothetical protein
MMGNRAMTSVVAIAVTAVAMAGCRQPAAKVAGPPAPLPARAQAGPTPELLAQLAAARKPAAGQPLIIGGKEVCGPKGNASDPQVQDLDNNKNRTDEPAPADYIAVNWAAMNSLPAAQVNAIQGAPVEVVGYLSHEVKAQTDPPGESTNCNLLQPDEVDWHIYLTQQPNQPIQDAIIVETTPRVRPHHKRTTQMLEAYVNANKPVRISGWLMYDFEHLADVGTERSTVWEVHPITRIEVQNARAAWVNIEQ